ncbi:MAG: hypothetical protein OXC00_06540 [Acidimicrobiaceae bacterium]|nr:hypothetical protein [Acidimicrobiaceae bacterium]
MALARDAAKESPPRDALRLEDVLDSDALAEVERAQVEAETAAPSRMSDQAARESALDVDDLRELVDRARSGEHVSLKKI